MENSSNAIIMAGEILIFVLVASLLVYIFSLFGRFSIDMHQQMEMSEIEEFNIHFLSNEYRIDLTSNDVVSAINFAREWNLKHGYTLGGNLDSHKNDPFYVTVYIGLDDVFEKSGTYNFAYDEKHGADYTKSINKYLQENVNQCYGCCCTPSSKLSNPKDYVKNVDENKDYYKRSDYKKKDIRYVGKMVRAITFNEHKFFDRDQLPNIIIL